MANEIDISLSNKLPSSTGREKQEIDNPKNPTKERSAVEIGTIDKKEAVKDKKEFSLTTPENPKK